MKKKIIEKKSLRQVLKSMSKNGIQIEDTDFRRLYDAGILDSKFCDFLSRFKLTTEENFLEFIRDYSNIAELHRYGDCIEQFEKSHREIVRMF